MSSPYDLSDRNHPIRVERARIAKIEAQRRQQDRDRERIKDLKAKVRKWKSVVESIADDGCGHTQRSRKDGPWLTCVDFAQEDDWCWCCRARAALELEGDGDE